MVVTGVVWERSSCFHFLEVLEVLDASRVGAPAALPFVVGGGPLTLTYSAGDSVSDTWGPAVGRPVVVFLLGGAREALHSLALGDRPGVDAVTNSITYFHSITFSNKNLISSWDVDIPQLGPDHVGEGAVGRGRDVEDRLEVVPGVPAGLGLEPDHVVPLVLLALVLVPVEAGSTFLVTIQLVHVLPHHLVRHLQPEVLSVATIKHGNIKVSECFYIQVYLII